MGYINGYWIVPGAAAAVRQLAESPALMWYVGPERGGSGFNRAWELLSGVGRSDLSADGWLGLIHPDDRGKLAFLRDPMSSSAPCSLDVRIRDEAGRHRWFLLSCGRSNASSGRALAALSIDERKSAELETELELAGPP